MQWSAVVRRVRRDAPFAFETLTSSGALQRTQRYLTHAGLRLDLVKVKRFKTDLVLPSPNHCRAEYLHLALLCRPSQLEKIATTAIRV